MMSSSWAPGLRLEGQRFVDAKAAASYVVTKTPTPAALAADDITVHRRRLVLWHAARQCTRGHCPFCDGVRALPNLDPGVQP